MPKLATECVPDAEGVVWTCALREGVTFHDGSAFDANDVVASWSASLDGANPLHTGNTGVFEYPAAVVEWVDQPTAHDDSGWMTL